jgi:hypothetical protein
MIAAWEPTTASANARFEWDEANGSAPARICVGRDSAPASVNERSAASWDCRIPPSVDWNEVSCNE